MSVSGLNLPKSDFNEVARTLGFEMGAEVCQALRRGPKESDDVGFKFIQRTC